MFSYRTKYPRLRWVIDGALICALAVFVGHAHAEDSTFNPYVFNTAYENELLARSYYDAMLSQAEFQPVIDASVAGSASCTNPNQTTMSWEITYWPNSEQVGINMEATSIEYIIDNQVVRFVEANSYPAGSFNERSYTFSGLSSGTPHSAYMRLGYHAIGETSYYDGSGEIGQWISSGLIIDRSVVSSPVQFTTCPNEPITPVCVAHAGESCTSAANACGQTNAGTYQCDGSCSASTPSDAQCPLTSPDGYFEYAGCDILQGWAYDPSNKTAQLEIHVYKDAPAAPPYTHLVTSFRTDVNRPDVNAYANTTGNHGFSVPTPESLKDGLAHSLYLYALDSDGTTNSLLTNSPRQIQCAQSAWTPYCTGGNDPNGNNWQWWEYDNSTPTNYRYLRPGDGTCTPLPDLAAGGTDVWPNPAAGGDTVNFSAGVFNAGSAPATNFPNVFQIVDGANTDVFVTAVTGSRIARADVSEWAPDGTTGSISSLAPGAYQVRACANYDTAWNAGIEESDYGNNCGGWSPFTVGAAPVGPQNPDPTISCNADGTVATIAWSASDGATTYYPRVYIDSGNCPYGWGTVADPQKIGAATCYVDQWTGDDAGTGAFSINFPTTPDMQYSTWVHGGNPTPNWDDAPTNKAFSCHAQSTSCTLSADPSSLTGPGTVRITATIEGFFATDWTGTLSGYGSVGMTNPGPWDVQIDRDTRFTLDGTYTSAYWFSNDLHCSVNVPVEDDGGTTCADGTAAPDGDLSKCGGNPPSCTDHIEAQCINNPDGTQTARNPSPSNSCQPVDKHCPYAAQGFACYIAPDGRADCDDPELPRIDFTVSPILVHKDDPTNVSWVITPTNDSEPVVCTAHSSNAADRMNGATSPGPSSGIRAQTQFWLTCEGTVTGEDVSFDPVTVNLIPDFEEQ